MRWLIDCTSRPCQTSQSFIGPSSEPETSKRPSAEKSTVQTAPSWPVRVCMICPLEISHRQIEPSAEQEASRFPFGDHATPYTISVYRRRCCNTPLCASQMHMLLSKEQEARKRLS